MNSLSTSLVVFVCVFGGALRLRDLLVVRDLPESRKWTVPSQGLLQIDNRQMRETFTHLGQ